MFFRDAPSREMEPVVVVKKSTPDVRASMKKMKKREEN